jgi:hypothetical protein
MNKKIKFKTKEIHSNLFLQSSRQTGTYALYYNARESLQKRNTPLVGVVQTVLQKSIMLRILADRMIKRLPHGRYLRRAHEASEFHQQIFVTSKKRKKTPTTKQNKTKKFTCSLILWMREVLHCWHRRM